MDTQENPITQTRVPPPLMSQFLPRHFRAYMLSFEHGTYAHMRRLTDGYTGGVWDYIELSNGGAYMAPRTSEQYEVTEPNNYFSATLSADATGILASLHSISDLMWKLREDWIIQKYNALLEYARQHPESGALHSAID